MATEGRAKTAEQQERSQKQVFIVGSKGIPANYGGFETFVEKLTQHQKSSQIRYHVVRMSDQKGRFEYNGVNCINIKVPPMGPAKAVYYDLAGLEYCIQYCKNRPWIQNPIFTSSPAGLAHLSPLINVGFNSLVELFTSIQTDMNGSGKNGVFRYAVTGNFPRGLW